MDARAQLLDRIRPVLVCPTCRGSLADRGDALACGACGLAVPQNGPFSFAGLTEEEQSADWLNAVKAAAKHRLGRLYPLAMSVLGPVYGNAGLAAFLGSFGADEIVCDLGAGTHTI